jgi:hypothetical protein
VFIVDTNTDRAALLEAAARRRRIAELLAGDPHQSLRRVAAAAGTSPTTVMDVRDRLLKGQDPLPPRLRQHWQRDPVLAADPQTAAFATWFDSRSVSDGDWEDFIDTVPMTRLFQVIDDARRRAESWQRFAGALRERLVERQAR